MRIYIYNLVISSGLMFRAVLYFVTAAVLVPAKASSIADINVDDMRRSTLMVSHHWRADMVGMWQIYTFQCCMFLLKIVSLTLSKGEGGFCQVKTATCHQTKSRYTIGWCSKHPFIDWHSEIAQLVSSSLSSLCLPAFWSHCNWSYLMQPTPFIAPQTTNVGDQLSTLFHW
jgi:hypothetical protein